MVICLERDADLHMAQLMPLPLTVSCFSKIQVGFTFLVPAHLGSPGKGPLNGCVCVCVFSGQWHPAPRRYARLLVHLSVRPSVCPSVTLMVCDDGHSTSQNVIYIHTYTVLQKRPPSYFLNNSVKNQSILITFGRLNPEKV